MQRSASARQNHANRHNQGALFHTNPQPLICDKCGAAAIAVAPGSAPVQELYLLLRHGEPRRQWCAACWPAAREAVA
jgi:hypothetical protein